MAKKKSKKKAAKKKDSKKKKALKKRAAKKKALKKKNAKKKKALKKHAGKKSAIKKGNKKKAAKKQKASKKSIGKELATPIAVLPEKPVDETAKPETEKLNVKSGPKAKSQATTTNFTDHSSNYNVGEAVKILRSLKNSKEVDIFTKGEKRLTITRVIPGVKRRLSR